MKKLISFAVTLVLFPAFIYAQVINLPSVEIKASQDKVPFKVKQAVIRDFGKGHQPIVWISNSSYFDIYGWELGSKLNIDNTDVYYYGIHVKKGSGSELYAYYTSEGKLFRANESVRNFVLPMKILLALQNSGFKDWGVTKDLYQRKVTSKGKELVHYDLVLKKGGERKRLILDKEGNMLISKSELAALTEE